MFRSVIPALLAVALTACGGGGSGGGSGGGQAVPNTPVSTAAGIFSAVSSSVSFSYYRNGTNQGPISYIFPRDIDGDGIDEIFFVGFDSHNNSNFGISNTSIRILGWQSGQFQDLTSRWLPSGADQVEAVGDLCFGDFNRDGKIDVFLSAYTDLNVAAHPYVLINNGSFFSKTALAQQTWMHAVACGDINQDGYDDVVSAGYGSQPVYLGSSAGLIEYSGGAGGSGIALGDFLGNGTLQVVATDNGIAPNDTKLYSIEFEHSKRNILLSTVAALSPVRIDSALGRPGSSHDIRAKAVDFDADGKLDIVVFSYLWNATDGDGYRSEIQFLKNTGSGNFIDVTDSVRVGYDTHGYVGYMPQFRDFNGDGRIDLFTSQPDWNSSGVHRSTTLMLQNNQGKFVDTEKSNLNKIIGTGGTQAAIARGPNSKWFLVKEHGISGAYTQSTVSIQPINF